MAGLMPSPSGGARNESRAFGGVAGLSRVATVGKSKKHRLYYLRM